METVLEPSKHTGRIFGIPNLTDEKKADILAQKNLRLESHNKIASNLNVSRQTVVKIKPETVEPHVLALANQKTKDIAENLARVRDKTLVYIEEMVDARSVPTASLPTFYGVLFDKHRLQTDQSTANVSVKTEAINLMLSNGTAMDLATAEALYLQASGEESEGE